MKKNKNVIPELNPVRRLTIAWNHVLQAERQVNAVSINARSVTQPLEQVKRALIFMISELQKEKE